MGPPAMAVPVKRPRKTTEDATGHALRVGSRVVPAEDGLEVEGRVVRVGDEYPEQVEVECWKTGERWTLTGKLLRRVG